MLEDVLQQTFLNNRVMDYIISFSVLLAGIALVRIIQSIVLRRLKLWAEKTASRLDDILIHLIEKKVLPLLYIGIFYISIQSLTLNPAISRGLRVLVIIALTIYAVRLLLDVVVYLFETYWAKEEDASRKLALRVILTSLKVIFWSVAAIILLDNLGIKVSALIAGLGIGGIAVGFAVQAILKDLFNYFVIFFDRPFEIGDFIIVGDLMGTVEHVGLKSTRLTSLGGEQLVFSNTDLTDSRIRNYKKMQKRRVVFRLGVTYQTTLEQLREIPEIIADIISKMQDTVFDRTHFFSYGDFALIYEVVYYVASNDYNKYMDIQQDINFRTYEEFQKRGIEFAYPTQTLYINKP